MLSVREVDPKEYEKRHAEVSDELAVKCSACGRVRARFSIEVVDHVLLCRDCVKEREEQQAKVEAENHPEADLSALRIDNLKSPATPSSLEEGHSASSPSGKGVTAMEFHEVCLAFPLMDDGAFKELCEDIKANGLRNEIVTYQGKIIDGRNRYNACREVGVAPRMREWDVKGSLVAYVVSMNLQRRHLTQSQRAALMNEVMPQLHEEAAKRQEATRAKPGEQAHRRVVEKIPPPQEKGKARDHAAKIGKVNSRYIDAAAKIKGASPELYEKVRASELTIPQAQKVLAGATIEEVKKRKPRKKKEPVPAVVADKPTTTTATPPELAPAAGAAEELATKPVERRDQVIDETMPGKPAEDQASTTPWGVILNQIEKLQEMLKDAPKPTPDESTLVLAAAERLMRSVQELARRGQDPKEPSHSPSEPSTPQESDSPTEDWTARSVFDGQVKEMPAGKDTAREANPPQLEPVPSPDEELIVCRRNPGDEMKVSHCRDSCRDRKDCADYLQWKTAAAQARRLVA